MNNTGAIRQVTNSWQRFCMLLRPYVRQRGLGTCTEKVGDIAIPADDLVFPGL